MYNNIYSNSLLVLLLIVLMSNSAVAQEDCNYWSEVKVSGEEKRLSAGQVEINILYPLFNPYEASFIDWYVSPIPNFEIDESTATFLGPADFSFSPLGDNSRDPKILFLKDSPVSNDSIIDYISIWSGDGFYVDDFFVKNENLTVLDGDEINTEFENFPISERSFIPKNTIVVLLFNDSISTEEVWSDFDSVDSCHLAFLKYDVTDTDFNTERCTNTYALGKAENPLLSRITFNGDRLEFENKRIILNTYPVRYVTELPDFDSLLDELSIIPTATMETDEIQTLSFCTPNVADILYVKGVLKGDGVIECCELTSPEFLINIESTGVLYPNPATRSIYLGMTLRNNYAYKIWSTDGRLHTKGQNSPDLKEIDVSFLGAGIYILEITDLVTKEIIEEYFVRVRL